MCRINLKVRILYSKKVPGQNIACCGVETVFVQLFVKLAVSPLPLLLANITQSTAFGGKLASCRPWQYKNNAGYNDFTNQ